MLYLEAQAPLLNCLAPRQLDDPPDLIEAADHREIRAVLLFFVVKTLVVEVKNDEPHLPAVVPPHEEFGPVEFVDVVHQGQARVHFAEAVLQNVLQVPILLLSKLFFYLLQVQTQQLGVINGVFALGGLWVM